MYSDAICIPCRAIVQNCSKSGYIHAEYISACELMILYGSIGLWTKYRFMFKGIQWV